MGYYPTQMKNWTLESPGAALVLHLGLFTLVSATVLYSEHHAAPTVAPQVQQLAPAARPIPVQASTVSARPVAAAPHSPTP